MPPDDARRQDARFWLARAELDLKAARLEAKSRYPGETGEPDRKGAESALKKAREVHDAVAAGLR